jgi:hypothetical protein
LAKSLATSWQGWQGGIDADMVEEKLEGEEEDEEEETNSDKI